MSSRPWYQWYPADYLADTLHLTLAQDAIYRRLLDALWINGPLPDDTKQLARILRVDTRQLRNSWEVVSRLLSISNGLVDHPKMARQRTQVIEVQAKRALAGQKGGLAKATNARATRSRSIKNTSVPEPKAVAGAHARGGGDAQGVAAKQPERNSTGNGARRRTSAPKWSDYDSPKVCAAAKALDVGTIGKTNRELFPELAARFRGSGAAEQALVWSILEGST